PFVRTALRAAAARAPAPRLRAAPVACFESACFDAAARSWRLRTRVVALEREREVRRGVRRLPAAASWAALRRVLAEVLAPGGGSFTPARRALDSPIAIA